MIRPAGGHPLLATARRGTLLENVADEIHGIADVTTAIAVNVAITQFRAGPEPENTTDKVDDVADVDFVVGVHPARNTVAFGPIILPETAV